MSYKTFISEAKARAELDEFLRSYLKDAGYSSVQVLKTPLGISISISVSRPGLVIGPGGRNIRELGDVLGTRFGIKNPQIGVNEVENPFLDPQIVASRICDALEKGVRFRRVVRWAMRRVVDAGALGVQIRVAGKLSSDRSRFVKFTLGYVPSSGEPAIKNVRTATKNILLPQGLTGVKVKILPPGVEFPDKFTILESASEAAVAKVEAQPAKEAKEEAAGSAVVSEEPEGPGVAEEKLEEVGDGKEE